MAAAAASSSSHRILAISFIAGGKSSLVAINSRAQKSREDKAQIERTNNGPDEPTFTADRREAGSRGGSLSSALPVTGSASPSAYRRKLAEAAYNCLSDKLEFTNEARINAIAAVLASEGVVDPEQYKAAQALLIETRAASLRLSAKVERLEADAQRWPCERLRGMSAALDNLP